MILTTVILVTFDPSVCRTRTAPRRALLIDQSSHVTSAESLTPDNNFVDVDFQLTELYDLLLGPYTSVRLLTYFTSYDSNSIERAYWSAQRQFTDLTKLNNRTGLTEIAGLDIEGQLRRGGH